MPDEMTQDNVQDSHETSAKTVTEEPSNPNAVRDMMKYKAQRNEAWEKLEKRDAQDNERRQKKLADEGKLQELLAEKDASFSKLKTENESLIPIRDRYKQTLVDGLSTEEERKEYLLTKSVDFLEELTKEKASMQPPAVSNPQESLGAVRSQSLTEGIINKMTPEEKRTNWSEITEYFNNKT